MRILSTLTTLSLSGMLPAAIIAQTGTASPVPPPANAAIAKQSEAAMKRLRDAVAVQRRREPSAVPKLPVIAGEPAGRRAFDALRRSSTDTALDHRARATAEAGSKALAEQREAMARRLGQALGLEAPDMTAIAKAAPSPARHGWIPVLFVSSSMPTATLRTYAGQLERVGGVFAFRGMPGGLRKVAPMAKLSAEILRVDPGCNGPACTMRNVQLIVDPILFRTSSVTRVPALVMVPGDASRTIAAMPANFIRYPNSAERVFAATPGRAPRGSFIALDADALGAFGMLTVPGHVWRTMQRLGVWIEPVLAAEWARLMRGYMERQGRSAAPGELEAALAWVEPRRDVSVARDVALARLRRGDGLHCVWSDRPLSDATLDIDHCLPWSAWPCGDLWNLMPAHRTLNQREKRDLLPSANALAAARNAIVDWWDEAWRSNEALAARFGREAGAALPVATNANSEAVFDGLAWRRLKLRQDQQLTEWSGHRKA